MGVAAVPLFRVLRAQSQVRERRQDGRQSWDLPSLGSDVPSFLWQPLAGYGGTRVLVGGPQGPRGEAPAAPRHPANLSAFSRAAAPSGRADTDVNVGRQTDRHRRGTRASHEDLAHIRSHTVCPLQWEAQELALCDSSLEAREPGRLAKIHPRAREPGGPSSATEAESSSKCHRAQRHRHRCARHNAPGTPWPVRRTRGHPHT